MRCTRLALMIGVAAAALLPMNGAAIAASSSNVVGPHGTVAGKGYGYYVGKMWQVIFESPAKDKNYCSTATVGGKTVAMIWSKAVAKGSGSYDQTCTEPAGRPIYLQHVADECSTFKGDHAGFGTTDAQLKKCARHPFADASGTTTVDGHQLAHPNRYLAASHAYAINLHNSNYFGYKRHHGRSAAYGYGVLLHGLDAGTHKVVVSGKIPSFNFHIKVTYTIVVQ